MLVKPYVLSEPFSIFPTGVYIKITRLIKVVCQLVFLTLASELNTKIGAAVTLFSEGHTR